MSSFRNAKKTQRVHRERSQPEERYHLGFLQKKKDYKERAEAYQKNQEQLKILKRKAAARNPDEFYHNMTRTKKVNGVHQLREERRKGQLSEDQRKLHDTQDIRYLNFLLTRERKKIEKLTKSLSISETPQNKHIIFVDSAKEVKNFKPEEYYDTHPALLDRAHNRLRQEQLRSGRVVAAVHKSQQEDLLKERRKKEKELSKRLKREKELRVLVQKMETKVQTMDKKKKKVLVAPETKDAPAQYRFCFVRQK